MCRALRRIALLFLFLFLAAPLAACDKSDSIVVVHVDVDPAVTGVIQLRAQVSNGGDGSTRMFPSTPATQAIAFPTSFSLSVPRDRTGALDVALDGLGDGGPVVAHGDGTVDLHVGDNVTMMITLQAGPSTCGNNQVDAGEECDDGDRLSAGDCDYLCHARAGGPGVGGRGGATGMAGTGGAGGTGGGARGGTGGGACRIELLTNGDFEAGETGWSSQSPDGRALIYRYADVDPTIAPPAQSVHIAWLGYDLISDTVVLSQAIAIPANAVSFTVSGSVYIQTDDSPSTQYDFAYVETLVGAFVDSEGTWSNIDRMSSWMPFSVTRPANNVAGASGTFQLRVMMDDGANTSFFFDNLSFAANVCP